MRQKPLKKKGHFWRLNGTLPNPDQTYPNYGYNIAIGVVAENLESAIAAARREIPNATFLDVHHYGETHIIDRIA